MAKYATVKRGKVKVPLGSKQHRFLEAKGLPYSIVTTRPGKPKSIKRMNTGADAKGARGKRT